MEKIIEGKETDEYQIQIVESPHSQASSFNWDEDEEDLGAPSEISKNDESVISSEKEHKNN